MKGMIAPSEAPAPRLSSLIRPRLGPTVFVWSIWLAMTLFAGLFVVVYGSNVPHWDDADILPYLAGERDVSAVWLWTPHNEHRIPLPKLMCVALARASGCDLRAAMLFIVLMLSAATAVLLLAVRLQRGSTWVFDAVLPLILLHVGQQQNLLWGFQVTFVSGAVLVILLLAAVLLCRSDGALVLAAGGVVLLPLCGSNGLAFAPPMALWLMFAGGSRLQKPGGRRIAVGLLIAAMATFALVLLYLYGWQGPLRRGVTPSAFDVMRVTAQFFSTAPGPAVRPIWPIAAIVLLGLSLVTALLLGRAIWQRDDRVRALGLLALLVGFAGLTLAVGWGRAHLIGDVGLANRYVTLTAPLLVLLYCAWELYLPAIRARWLQGLLFAAFVAMLVPNVLHGLNHGREYRIRALAVEYDARAGVPTLDLVRRHGRILCSPANEAVMVEVLDMLRRRRLGPYE